MSRGIGRDAPKSVFNILNFSVPSALLPEALKRPTGPEACGALVGTTISDGWREHHRVANPSM